MEKVISAPPAYEGSTKSYYNNEIERKNKTIIDLNQKLVDLYRMDDDRRTEIENLNELLSKEKKKKKNGCCLVMYNDCITCFNKIDPLVWFVLMLIVLIGFLISINQKEFHTFEGSVTYQYLGNTVTLVGDKKHKYRLDYVWENNEEQQTCYLEEEIILDADEEFEYNGIVGSALIKVAFSNENFYLSDGECYDGTYAIQSIDRNCTCV